MRYCFLIVVFFLCISVYAQDVLQLGVVGSKATYSLNEDILVKVDINESTYKGLKNKNVTISYGVEGSENKFTSFDYRLKSSSTEIAVKGGLVPQVMRIKATINIEDKQVTKEIGVAIAPDLLQSSVSKPKDFDDFWKSQIADLQPVKLDPIMIMDSALTTGSYDVYQINYQVDKSGSRFYAVLTIPKKTKGYKFPAVVVYPGAGVRAYTGDYRFIKDSVITLQVGVHGIPVNSPKELYTSLATGSLNGYQYFNLQSKEQYYFNRVIKGCLRALDFLETLEQFDGTNVIANGSSQGGALSLIVTALDKRIKAVAVYCPAMSQTNGSLFNKPTGWPKPLARTDLHTNNGHDWKAVIPYYDVVNFSSNIQVPVFMTFGAIDDVTPATTIFSAYNSINSEKEYDLKVNVQHANHPSQIEKVKDYILKKIR